MWNEDQVTFESFIDPLRISFPQTLWGFFTTVVSLISLKSLFKSFLRSVFYVTFCLDGVWPSPLLYSPGPDNQRLFLSCDTNMENWRELQRWGWGRGDEESKINVPPPSICLVLHLNLEMSKFRSALTKGKEKLSWRGNSKLNTNKCWGDKRCFCFGFA